MGLLKSTCQSPMGSLDISSAKVYKCWPRVGAGGKVRRSPKKSICNVYKTTPRLLSFTKVFNPCSITTYSKALRELFGHRTIKRSLLTHYIFQHRAVEVKQGGE